MLFVNKDSNIDLNKLVNFQIGRFSFSSSSSINVKIIKHVNKLIMYNNHEYMYGNSWIDRCFRNYRIRKLNNIMKKNGYLVMVV